MKKEYHDPFFRKEGKPISPIAETKPKEEEGDLYIDVVSEGREHRRLKTYHEEGGKSISIKDQWKEYHAKKSGK